MIPEDQHTALLKETARSLVLAIAPHEAGMFDFAWTAFLRIHGCTSAEELSVKYDWLSPTRSISELGADGGDISAGLEILIASIVYPWMSIQNLHADEIATSESVVLHLDEFFSQHKVLPELQESLRKHVPMLLLDWARANGRQVAEESDPERPDPHMGSNRCWVTYVEPEQLKDSQFEILQGTSGYFTLQDMKSRFLNRRKDFHLFVIETPLTIHVKGNRVVGKPAEQLDRPKKPKRGWEPMHRKFFGQVLVAASRGIPLRYETLASVMMGTDTHLTNSVRTRIQSKKSELNAFLEKALEDILVAERSLDMYRICPFSYCWVRSSRNASVLVPQLL